MSKRIGTRPVKQSTPDAAEVVAQAAANLISGRKFLEKAKKQVSRAIAIQHEAEARLETFEREMLSTTNNILPLVTVPQRADGVLARR